MKIRPMIDKDLIQVCDIENDTFSEPWRYNSFSNSLTSKDNTYLVAEEDGEILGYCGMWGTVDEGQITNVAVKKEHRNKKIGFKLMKTLMEYGKDNGLIAFTLEVRAGNRAAINLYHNLGFTDSGYRKNFYSKPNEDALIMWLGDRNVC